MDEYDFVRGWLEGYERGNMSDDWVDDFLYALEDGDYADIYNTLFASEIKSYKMYWGTSFPDIYYVLNSLVREEPRDAAFIWLSRQVKERYPDGGCPDGYFDLVLDWLFDRYPEAEDALSAEDEDSLRDWCGDWFARLVIPRDCADYAASRFGLLDKA